jgi:adenosylmethionine-8-amino-7-oxononanoate aminotransferase
MMSRSWSFLVRPSEEPPPADWAVSARGTRVTFADGLEAYCATSGLWNVPLGYGRNEIAEAVARTLRDASYLTLFRRSHVYAEEAAGRLIAFTGMPFTRVLFATSGGAANDLTMKLCRQYWSIEGRPQRRIVVGLRGSYHGLTFGAHALGGEDLGQALYGVDGRDVRHVPFDDGGAALESLFRREGVRIAAVVIEPVLGSGAFEVPEAFLQTMQRLREHYGFLLVADEVATGFGRTGTRFASGQWSERPDVLVMSKALTNGTCPAAAVAVNDRIASAFRHHDALLVHGETQAGTPPSCAAIIATLELFDEMGADALFRSVSTELDRVEARLLESPRVLGARGRGAFRALHIVNGRSGEDISREEVLQLVERTRRRGVLAHPGPSGIQLIPAAVSTPADLDRAADALLDALDERDAA